MKSRRRWRSRSWFGNLRGSPERHILNPTKVQTLAPPNTGQKAFIRPGFRWDAADAYLFDIDGTLLNSRDAVHYFSFLNASREILGREITLEGVLVHGNTDPGILRGALRLAGMDDVSINIYLPQIVERMCAEVERNQSNMRPELCPSIPELINYLTLRGKLLGAASGNLERVGWLKLEKAGLRPMFAFGSFSFPRQSRAEIFAHGIALAHQRLGEQTTVFVVGDTPSDIEAAHAVDAPVIALATGIFSFSDLVACNPDACFACASDLLALNQTT
ncbi:MAG TPA: HAD hydrolase-like protein [Candidatus Angelobacter sp.]|nr:HAD hydrolase-like protein [Candidatus Angelobacter sp.]